MANRLAVYQGVQRMPIEFLCRQCGTKLRVGDDAAGKQAKCPKCATVLDIPGTAAVGSELATSGGVPVVPPSGAAPNPYQAPGSYLPPQPMQFVDGPISHSTVDPGQVFSRSWDLFTKNFGLGIGAVIIYVLVTLLAFGLAFAVVVIPTIATGEGAGDEAALIVFLSAMVVVGIPMMLAIMLFYYNLTRFFLHLSRGEEASLGMLFRYDSNFWPFLGATLGFGLLTTVGYIFCIVPGVYLACMFFPWPLLVLDKRMPMGEAFNLSKELTEGNKMNLFIVGLIYMGISFAAGMISMGIGQILATPLLLFLFLVAYLMLTGQYVPAGQVSQPMPRTPEAGNPFGN